MATIAQLEEGIRRANAAGDAKAVQALGAQLRSLQAPKNKPEPSFWEKTKATAKAAGESVLDFAKGIPEGVENVVNIAADPIAGTILEATIGRDKAKAAIEASERRQRARYGKAKQPIARDIGRGLGGAVIPIPGGPVLQQGGRAGRVALRALQGAAGGAAVREPGQSAVTPATVGAAANVVLPPVLGAVARPIVNVAGKGASYLKGLAKPPVAPTVADLGPEAAIRAARFKELGLKPTTAMVTRNPTAHEFEKNAVTSPAGVELADQIANVEKGLIAKGKELVGKFSSLKPTPEGTGIAAQKALETKQTEMQAITSKLYDDVKDTRGDELVGRLDILRERMTDPDLVDDPLFDNLRTGIMRRMESLGLVSKDGRISKGITLNQAEGFRKFIGRLGNGTDPNIRRMRAALIDALDDDVVDVIGDDAFKVARASARARFEEFNKSLAGKIASEGLAPEKLTKHIFSERTSLDDVRSLVKSFTTGTPEQIARGTAARTQLKAQGIDDLLTSAIDEEGQRVTGRTLLNNFVKQSPKLKIILDPKEFKELETLVLASRDATTTPSGLLTENAEPIAKLFQSLPPKVRDSWAKFLLKSSAAHSAAFMTGGPAANVALGVGQATAGSAIDRRAADIFMRKIQMAKSPEETAKAIAAAKKAAERNPIIDELLKKHGIVGTATAAATTGEQ